MKSHKKLIEVALPLEAINKASAREKSIRHGHPSTLHLWWARRPLAAARSVIFAQMVDDPSSLPDLFPTEKKQQRERERLFKIIEDLVQWENTTNEEVLKRARAEIWQSWRRSCAENADHPHAKELFDRGKLPSFHDPFAGGGALPLEAQRLGLNAYASDLNPVSVLINKAVIEIPPSFAGKPPVNAESRRKMGHSGSWKGAQGLAEDVRYYGQWMRDEAERRIGNLYPPIEVTGEMANDRPDLKPYVGQKLTVIAWLWARTVRSPNPAFSGVDVPLVSTFLLSTKAGREAYVEPVIEGSNYRFSVKMGSPPDLAVSKNGTRAGKAQDFLCLLSGAPIPREYIREQGKAGRIGARLMAIVADTGRSRVYLPPIASHEAASSSASTFSVVAEARATFLSGATPTRAMITGGVCSAYGLSSWGHLFTDRQVVALTTFADLVQQVRDVAKADALEAGLSGSESAVSAPALAQAYADAVATYLSLGVSKLADSGNALVSWKASMDQPIHLFTRQALPMVWDFAEPNIFANAMGDLLVTVRNIARVIEQLPATCPGTAQQDDAQRQTLSEGKIVSADPPYFDNIGYADLSDFFYVWLRRCLKPIYPSLFGTVSTPKAEELVATVYRHGSKDKAEAFFLNGMTSAMRRIGEQAHPAYPVTIYYAFKQSEVGDGDGVTNTGWDTFLAAVIRAGFTIEGTWPIRTELSNRIVGVGTNALASSVVLVCRKRAPSSATATRREFITALKTELPIALRRLQEGNIAPVDLAQASIGPGMAVYTRYERVVDAEGTQVSVRDALALINEVLDETLAEQEGDFDSDSRFAIAWFEQHGFAEGEFGVADVLARAKNTSVNGLGEAGVLASKRGKVRLLKPSELPGDWDPATDARLTHWETVHHLIRVLEAGGESAAASLVAKLGSKAEVARELAYRLYTVCERKKRAPEALAYNALVQSFPEITRLASEDSNTEKTTKAGQGGLFDEV